MRRPVLTNGAPQPGAAYSQAIASGDLVACTGQVGASPATGQLVQGVAAQTQQAVSNLTAVLAAAGCTWTDVIKTTCFLADIGEFRTFDEAYAAAVPQPYPARSTFGVGLAGGILVEIEALAVRPTTADADR